MNITPAQLAAHRGYMLLKHAAPGDKPFFEGGNPTVSPDTMQGMAFQGSPGAWNMPPEVWGQAANMMNQRLPMRMSTDKNRPMVTGGVGLAGGAVLGGLLGGGSGALAGGVLGGLLGFIADAMGFETVNQAWEAVQNWYTQGNLKDVMSEVVAAREKDGLPVEQTAKQLATAGSNGAANDRLQVAAIQHAMQDPKIQQDHTAMIALNLRLDVTREKLFNTSVRDKAQALLPPAELRTITGTAQVPNAEFERVYYKPLEDAIEAQERAKIGGYEKEVKKTAEHAKKLLDQMKGGTFTLPPMETIRDENGNVLQPVDQARLALTYNNAVHTLASRRIGEEWKDTPRQRNMLDAKNTLEGLNPLAAAQTWKDHEIEKALITGSGGGSVQALFRGWPGMSKGEDQTPSHHGRPIPTKKSLARDAQVFQQMYGKAGSVGGVPTPQEIAATRASDPTRVQTQERKDVLRRDIPPGPVDYTQPGPNTGYVYPAPGQDAMPYQGSSPGMGAPPAPAPAPAPPPAPSAAPDQMSIPAAQPAPVVQPAPSPAPAPAPPSMGAGVQRAQLPGMTPGLNLDDIGTPPGVTPMQKNQSLQPWQQVLYKQGAGDSLPPAPEPDLAAAAAPSPAPAPAAPEPAQGGAVEAAAPAASVDDSKLQEWQLKIQEIEAKKGLAESQAQGEVMKSQAQAQAAAQAATPQAVQAPTQPQTPAASAAQQAVNPGGNPPVQPGGGQVPVTNQEDMNAQMMAQGA